jgi:GTP 3',8-cyclase
VTLLLQANAAVAPAADGGATVDARAGAAVDARAALPASAPAAPRDRLDRPLHDLRLSVIDACNFRCGYCMPADRIADDHGLDAAGRLGFDEIETLVRGFARMGVRKLRLTGGEPLLRKGLPALVARLAAVPGIEDLALTTNGALLARHARALRDAGLRRITISLDALEPALFRALSGGRGEVDDVLAGIAAAEDAGFGRIKFNCVVQRGVNDHEVPALVERFRGSGHVIRFIEYMDVGTCNGWDRARVVPSAELRDRVHALWPLRALEAGYRGEVAERHAFVDGQGEVGFVSSVTAPFCGDCHRARVSADGTLYTCLFAGAGHDLRPWLAQGEAALATHAARLWSRRGDRYSELRDSGHAPRRRVEMFLVGG